jgi:hypothetical protein
MPHLDDLTRRAFALDHAFLALGHETFDAEGASFVRDPAYPRVYDANHVRAVRTATPDAVERLVEQKYLLHLPG